MFVTYNKVSVLQRQMSDLQKSKLTVEPPRVQKTVGRGLPPAEQRSVTK